MFKIYKDEAKNQHNRKITTVRSDRGGEYYGIYNESGRCSGPFINFLKEWYCSPVHHAWDTSSEWCY